jgi:hypothetical protein
MKLRLALIVIALLVLPLKVEARPKLLSDSEMDRVTARGTDFEFNFNPDTGGLNFNFNAGATIGNGSVISSPAVGGTSNSTNLPGISTLSNNTFVVDNMILNLNICAMCNATVINQLGLGLGVTVNPMPPTTAP